MRTCLFFLKKITFNIKPKPKKQEAAFLIFGMIVANDQRIMQPHLAQIHGILRSALETVEVGKPVSDAQCAALTAASTFIQVR